METDFASTPLGIEFANRGVPSHEAVRLRKDESGWGLYASADIPGSTCVVTCPFSYVITPEKCRNAFKKTQLSTLNDHEAICTYLSFHRLYTLKSQDQQENQLEQEEAQVALNSTDQIESLVNLEHSAYILLLPAPSDLRTPLWYNETELNLLKGTNLFGVTQDLMSEWRQEWTDVCNKLQNDIEIPFKTYLWAATIFSSRAFPSSLVTEAVPQLNSDTPSYPILIPGLDSFNHRHNHPVTWVTTPEQNVALRTEIAIPAGAQIFNNYGPKSNEVLLYAYGFTIKDNEHDLVALKLPLPNSKRTFVGRDGTVPKPLLNELASFFESNNSGEEVQVEFDNVDWNTKFEVITQLGDMLGMKLQTLEQTQDAIQVEQDRKKRTRLENQNQQDLANVRSDVLTFITEYRQGQVDVMKSAIQYQTNLMEETIWNARQAGLPIETQYVDSDDEDELRH